MRYRGLGDENGSEESPGPKKKGKEQKSQGFIRFLSESFSDQRVTSEERKREGAERTSVK